MMGRAVANMDACTVKGSSSLLYLSEGATKRSEPGNGRRRPELYQHAALQPY